MNHLVAIGNRTCDSCIQYQQIHIGSFFSENLQCISLNAFSHQVGDEETKIEGRILYQEFDTWSPWISSDSPVSRLIPSKGFKMLSFSCAAKVVMWSLFAETGGLWRGDGPPPSNCHRRRRRFHPPASPHDPHCEEEEVAAEV